MPYIDGFVVPVPAGNRDAYLEAARKGWNAFQKFGALQMVETLSDNIPDGKKTDFRRAVAAESGEIVAFSWIIWPDKATRETAWEKMMTDPDMAAMGEMPFDASRMIYGGFAPIFDSEDMP
ncbi:DUF1428 domain-containing protein [Phaeovulum sp.]|jgi:uncharacterized protein YbaA (DUF1428 family)|uniref:DUF1428 domain-containing protein n=1 Tax=Phaeovulum sp. TaxID=2934796 RepID=UPI00272F6D16|nr:DUF1428 domain-containing protein [Phaeovulum sp.]MDP1667923.1 DUF1428 domain-containing protein [Phaeovulum sp.]MDZ4120176.1 DUF1428 domain-containing protein [Phaeovulum sp.]